MRYHPFSIGIPSTTSLATNAVFQVEEAGLLTVLNTGKVGIGTISPSYPLEVANAASVSIAYLRTGASAKKWGFHSDNANTYWQNLTDNILALLYPMLVTLVSEQFIQLQNFI